MRGVGGESSRPDGHGEKGAKGERLVERRKYGTRLKSDAAFIIQSR
jgi:hypothetical protein